jgi:hypothetical protein
VFAWSVVGLALRSSVTAADPMLQLQLQGVGAGKVAPKFPFDAFYFLVTRLVVGHAVNPSFGVRLQFILEFAQDFQGGLNFRIGRGFRCGCRIARLAHVRSSSQTESAMVHDLHNIRAQAG